MEWGGSFTQEDAQVHKHALASFVRAAVASPPRKMLMRHVGVRKKHALCQWTMSMPAGRAACFHCADCSM